MADNESSQYKPIIKVNPFTLTLMAVGLIMIIALVFGIKAWMDNSNKESEFTISNLQDKVRNMPRSARVRVQRALYSAVRSNVPYDQDIPQKGAVIREDQTIISAMDRDTNVYHASFIVDIESLQQSYNVQVEWVDEKAYEKNLSGYPTVVGCVDEAKAIYKDFDCTDMYGANGSDGSGILVTAHTSSVIGNFSKLKDSGMNEGIYRKLYKVIAQYYGSVYGSDYFLSLDKGSLKTQDGKFTFDLVSVNKDRFHFEVEINERNFLLNISTDKDELYSYDSSLFVAAKRNPKAINKRLLPHMGTTTNTNKKYTFKEYRENEYVIFVESCNKKSIEDEALAEVTEWLGNNDFDVKDFNIKTRGYCDKGI